MKILPALIVILICASHFTSDGGQNEILIDDFSAGLGRVYKEEKFVKRTVYTTVDAGAGKALKAVADASASLLIYKTGYDPAEFPVLSWRWKIGKVLEKGDARKKSADDFPARIYVVFHHWIPVFKRSINYVWANRLQKGQSVTSTYFSGSMIVAVQSGNEKAGKWIGERVNIYEDYKRLFGGEPPPVEAIGIMTDTDNTGERAVAWYADLKALRR